MASAQELAFWGQSSRWSPGQVWLSLKVRRSTLMRILQGQLRWPTVAVMEDRWGADGREVRSGMASSVFSSLQAAFRRGQSTGSAVSGSAETGDAIRRFRRMLRLQGRDGRLDGRHGRHGRRRLVRGSGLRGTRATRRGRSGQVPVQPVLGRAASVASARSGNGSRASTHACLAVVAGVDGGGRRWLTAASGAWGSTAPGGSWLEGQEETRREEGPGGGGSGRVQQAEMTDGEGRRR